MKTLYKQLKTYGESDFYPFHMPGHKRNEKLVASELPVSIDITEISDFDNLHHAEGILKEEQAFAASLYGANKSFFLVNGSTAGILAAISATVSEGETILIARNCHKSVYNAAYLRRLKLKYLLPELDSLGFPKAIEAEKVSRALTEDSSIKAVLITSPTYEGICSDIEKIAQICHRNKIPLIVDEAHGAHFAFGNATPKSAIMLGADIVIESLHKTLPSLTQTAIVHSAASDYIDTERLERFLSIYQTSSPSYVLMASISQCLHSLQKDQFDAYENRLRAFYQRCESLRHIKLWENESVKKDPGKLIIFDQTGTITGPKLFERLRDEYHLEFEMSMQKYVLGMTSICDTEEGFDRLFTALKEIDEQIVGSEQKNAEQKAIAIPEKAVELYEAMEAKTKIIPFSEAVGEIICEYIYLYPPGYPIIVPGERMDTDILGYIKECIKMEMNVQGPADLSLQSLKVAR